MLKSLNEKLSSVRPKTSDESDVRQFEKYMKVKLASSTEPENNKLITLMSIMHYIE